MVDHRYRTRLRVAVFHARLVYPGPVGELIARELLSWDEFGHRLGGNRNDHEAGRARPVDTGRRTPYPTTPMSHDPSYWRPAGDASDRSEPSNVRPAAVGPPGAE